MYYIYAIKSKEKNYIYVGLTNNPERRITEHNYKKEKTTRFYAPFETILIEKYNTRIEARRREKYLKSGVGKEYLKTLISCQLVDLPAGRQAQGTFQCTATSGSG